MDTRIVILLAASALLVVSLIYLLTTLLSGRRSRRQVLTAPAARLAPATELPEATEALRTPLRLGDWEPNDSEDLGPAEGAAPAMTLDEGLETAEDGSAGASASAAPGDLGVIEDDLDATLSQLALAPGPTHEAPVAEARTQAVEAPAEAWMPTVEAAGPRPPYDESGSELEDLLAPLDAEASWLPDPAAPPAAALAPASEWPPPEPVLTGPEPQSLDEAMSTGPAADLELEPLAVPEIVAGLEPVAGLESGSALEHPILPVPVPVPLLDLEPASDVAMPPDAFPESAPIPTFDAQAMGTGLEEFGSAPTTAPEPVLARDSSAEMPLSALLAELEPTPVAIPTPAATVEAEPPAPPLWAAPPVAPVSAWEPPPAAEPHPWESPVPSLEPLLAEVLGAPAVPPAPEPAVAAPPEPAAPSPVPAHEAPEYRMVAPVELSFADGERRIGIRPGTATFLKYQRLAAVLLNDLKKSRRV